MCINIHILPPHSHPHPHTHPKHKPVPTGQQELPSRLKKPGVKRDLIDLLVSKKTCKGVVVETEEAWLLLLPAALSPARGRGKQSFIMRTNFNFFFPVLKRQCPRIFALERHVTEAVCVFVCVCVFAVWKQSFIMRAPTYKFSKARALVYLLCIASLFLSICTSRAGSGAASSSPSVSLAPTNLSSKCPSTRAHCMIEVSKETYKCQKTPTSAKRDLTVSQSARTLHDRGVKRDLIVLNETYKCQQTPTSAKRHLIVSRRDLPVSLSFLLPALRARPCVRPLPRGQVANE